MEGYSGLSTSIFTQRVEVLKAAAEARKLDAIFLFSDEYRPGNTVYVSDFKPINVVEESPQGIYIAPGEDPVLFLGPINAQAAKRVSWIEDIRSIETLEGFFDNVRRRARKEALKVGIVGDALLPLKYYRKMLGALGHNELVSVDDELTAMRQVKTSEEIKRMTQAAYLADVAIEAAVDALTLRGPTEIEVSAAAEYAMRSAGGDIGSATVLSSGLNTESPTWRPTNKRIEDGEVVLIDMAPSYRGYCSDVAVTVTKGKADSEQAELLALSRDILNGLIEEMKPGQPASFIYDYFKKRVTVEGLAEYFLPYAQGLRAVGHSVGLDVVEQPNLDADSAFELQPGMTLGVKFDLHGMSFGGIRMETVVLVGKSRCSSLSKAFPSPK